MAWRYICIYIYIFTYCMVQSPSSEANWFAASQEIPHISRNPKFHYHTHKCPPPVSILGQPNLVHIPTSHLLEIHPNIIHPLLLGLSSGLLPSGFPRKTLYTPSPHPYSQHVQPISFFSILSSAHVYLYKHTHIYVCVWQIPWLSLLYKLLPSNLLHFIRHHSSYLWRDALLSTASLSKPQK